MLKKTFPLLLTKRGRRATVESMTPLGRFIRDLRLAQGLTLEQTAARAKEKGYALNLRAIQAIEAGNSDYPRRETLEALAAALGVEVTMLALKVYEPPRVPTAV